MLFNRLFRKKTRSDRVNHEFLSSISYLNINCKKLSPRDVNIIRLSAIRMYNRFETDGFYTDMKYYFEDADGLVKKWNYDQMDIIKIEYSKYFYRKHIHIENFCCYECQVYYFVPGDS